jgi:CubicO group peptidase (beta-lactamase class C family)
MMRWCRSPRTRARLPREAGQSGEAGGVWHYDNMAAQVLEPVLTAALGRDIEAFARERLFEPLGLTSISWERDRSHNLLTYAGITASGADLGALGQLVLDQGVATGHQLVPSRRLSLSRPEQAVRSIRRTATCGGSSC